MKHFMVFLFALISISSYSQKKHEDGPYKEYYESGQVKKEGYYKNDKKISVWKDYYDTGQIKRVYTYNLDGESSGIGESYSIQGSLVSETKRAQNGGLISKHYFDSGKLSVIYALIPVEKGNGFLKDGGYKEYYENDTLKVESLYNKNELSGLWKQYYDTGEKEWEVAYIDGYKQGSYKQFYKNGQLKLEGWTTADLKNGVEKRYNEKGGLLWKGSYFKDDFDDSWTQYDSIGNSTNTLSYKNGKLKKGTGNIDLKQTVIPDGVIERVPVYPGCEDSPGNTGKKNCMSKNIAEFVSKKFNTDFAKKYGFDGMQRIFVIFKIDPSGTAVDIRARAPHQVLEQEAIRVVKLLPKMKPGIQRGKAVTVPYSLPIVFSVTKNTTQNNHSNPSIRDN